MGEVPRVTSPSAGDRRRVRLESRESATASSPTVVEIDTPLDFDEFYVHEHQRITRALAVTFGDAELAREASTKR